MRASFLVLFVFAAGASASSIQLTFDGVNGAQAFGHYVGPYDGQLGSTMAPLYSDDFANQVDFGQQWAANLSTITNGSDLSATRYGAEPDALTLYQEIAWLDTQYTSNRRKNERSRDAEIQATIWEIFDPSHAPEPRSDYWLKQAEKNYSKISYDDFRVVTNVGPVLPTGQVEEFITILPDSGISKAAVPEPSSFFLIGSGLIMISFGVRRLAGRRQRNEITSGPTNADQDLRMMRESTSRESQLNA